MEWEGVIKRKTPHDVRCKNTEHDIWKGKKMYIKQQYPKHLMKKNELFPKDEDVGK